MAEATGELRQRRPSGNQEAEAPETPVEAEEVVVTPTLAVAKDVQEKRRVNALLAVAESKSPPWLAEKLKKFRPAVEAILKFLGKVAPVVVRGGTKAYAIYTILPHDVILMLYGACLCFFGGYFAASVAAIEAFRLTGGDTMIACIRDLIDEWNSLKHANDKDDVEDEDKDGKADVDQISESQLAVRKTLLALRTLNPDRVTQAIGGLTMGCMGILSTLKVKFAKVAALGVSIGNMMRKPAAKILVPAAAFLLGKDSPYLRWVDPVINYLCKSVAVSIAWFIQQIISTVQSALNGGLIFARAGMRFAAKKGLIKNIDPDETYLDEVVGWSLAAVGIVFQIGSGLRLPFPLNVFLLPLEIIEWALRYAITWA